MWTRWGLILALVMAVLGLVALPSVAGLTPDSQGAQALDSPTQDTNVDCGACHDDATKQAFPNSDVCTSCHVLLGKTYQGSIHSEKTDTYANFDCLQCHSEPEDSWFMHFRSGPHGAQNPGISMAPEDTCAAAGCHDSHNPRGAIYAEWNETADEDWEHAMQSHSTEAPESARTEECSPCHGTHEGTFENIDAGSGDGFAVSDQPDPADVEEWRITCAACHNPHNVTAEDNLRGSFESDSQLCAQCHTDPDISDDQLDQYGSHPSMWEVYSESKFASEGGIHPQLECTSCHMGSQADTEEYNAWTGHDFDVNTTLLGDADRLDAPAAETCGNCHGDLAGTVSNTKESIGAHRDTATRLQEGATDTLADADIADKDELESRLADGSIWLDLVSSPSVGIHAPDRSITEFRRSIDTFESVRSAALDGDSADGQGEGDGTTTTTTPTTTTTTQPPSETETGSPGVGWIGALVALLLGGSLAIWMGRS